MIRLRPMSRTDLGESYCCMNDRQTARLINRDPAMSYAQHVAWFEQALRNPCRLLFSIEDGSGRYVGTCGFNHIDHRKQQAELWIVIDKYSRGFGYGTGATDTLVRYGFYEKGLTLIYLHVLAHNCAAINLYTRLGFRKTAKTFEGRGPDCLPEESIRMELDRIAYQQRALYGENQAKACRHANSCYR